MPAQAGTPRNVPVPNKSQVQMRFIVVAMFSRFPHSGWRLSIPLIAPPKPAPTKKTPNRDAVAIGLNFTHADSASDNNEIVSIQIHDPTKIPSAIRRFSPSQASPSKFVWIPTSSNPGIQVMTEVREARTDKFSQDVFAPRKWPAEIERKRIIREIR